MTTLERPNYKVIGTRPIRPDGVEKVTGKAQYGADIRLPGMAYAKILRSPHAHARIVSIDTSEAETMPGVLGVVTAKDFPVAADKIQDLGEGSVNLKELSDNILASEKVVTAIEVEEDKLKITRHNDFITFGGKFPRLTKKEATARLKEIKRLLLAM